MNIDEVLDTMGEEINKLSREAFEIVLKLVNEGVPPRDAIEKALSVFNGAYYEAVSMKLSDVLSSAVSDEYVKDMIVSNMTLSKALYTNQKTITAQAKQIINDHIKEGGTIKALATKLYEGYNFKDDPLKIKKGLPKYLIKEVDALSVKMADKLRTPALRASYLELINAKSEAEYKRKLKQAVYERNRYYANRIAQTETFRAYSEGEARLHMEDKELTTIKIKMSASHPTVDICDYHSSVNLYGLGAGVYPKEKAPRAPFHPHCRCRMIPKHSIDSTGAKLNPNAPKELFGKYPIHVQARILGSNAKLDRFNSGESIESLINEKVPNDYKLQFVGELRGLDTKPLIKKVEQKIPVIDFGYRGKFNNFVEDIRDEAKIVIDKLPKPITIKAVLEGKASYAPNKGILSTSKDKNTFLHEYGHHIDYAFNNSIKTGFSVDKFQVFIDKDAELLGLSGKLKAEIVLKYKEDNYDIVPITKIVRTIKGVEERIVKRAIPKYPQVRAMSDIIDAMLSGDAYETYRMFGHGKKYYRQHGTKEKETFANMFAIWADGTKWDEAVSLFPNTAKEFERIMMEIQK